ncbi:MAG: hypothetical protein ABGZ35_10700, partial [Planctomycetaceae bacterium]
GLVGQHEENLATENRRAARVTNGLNEIEAETEAAETFAAVNATDTKIASLEAHCRKEVEFKDLVAAGERLSDKRTTIQKRIDEAFQAELEKLVDEYEVVEGNDIDRLFVVREKFNVLNKTPDVTAKLRVPLRQLVVRITEQAATETTMRAQEQLVVSITEAVSSPSRYQSVLRTYFEKYPTSPRGLQFDRVLKEDAEFWNLIEEQNDFVARWSATDHTLLNPESAKARMQQGTEFLTRHPDFAGRGLLMEIIAYLSSVASRLSDSGEPTHASLDDVFRDPTVARLMMALTPDGRRFYTDEVPEALSGFRFKIQFFEDPSLATKAGRYFEADELSLKRNGKTIDWTAPQSAFAKEASRALKTMKDDEWEEVMLSLLSRLYRDERIEPIMKFQLFDNILPVAMQGSSLLQKTFEETADELRTIRLPTNLNIFDPFDKDTEKSRRDVVEFLATMSDPQTRTDEITRAKLRYRRASLGGRYQRIAWLYENNNKWVCSAPHPPDAGTTGELFIGGKLGSKAGFKRIGQIQDGQYKITVSSDSGFAEGQLVYLYAPPKSDENNQ